MALAAATAPNVYGAQHLRQHGDARLAGSTGAGRQAGQAHFVARHIITPFRLEYCVTFDYTLLRPIHGWIYAAVRVHDYRAGMVRRGLNLPAGRRGPQWRWVWLSG